VSNTPVADSLVAEGGGVLVLGVLDELLADGLWALGVILEYLQSLGALGILALGLGTVWLYVNLYNYLPVYVRPVYRLLGKSGQQVYTTGTSLPDEDLPTVDIFLPAYDEDETLRYALRKLQGVDYPSGKVTINVIVEASDIVTRRELALADDVEFSEVVVPPTYPGQKNKPRALNYAFDHTSADIIGVLDAEDIVQTDLLRQAVHALEEDNHDYVQGRLDMLNEDDGVLNTIFRGEYGFWYQTIIPSYFLVGYPVPLGGTTNFFRRDVLESAGKRRVERFGTPWTDVAVEDLDDRGLSGAVPWDPRNVTEDFELGFFLWEEGYDMAMMTATTREESPVGVDAWIRQRTRWQKGKLFTFYHRLHNRPTGIKRKLHIYTQSALPHLGPLNIAGVALLAGYANAVGFLAAPVVSVLLLTAFTFVGQHMLVQGLGYWSATDRRGVTRIRRTAVNIAGVPALWLLLWGADVRALLQLVFEQHHWEKTHHPGRHISDGGPTTAATLASAANLSLVVDNAKGDWTWHLETGDQTAESTILAGATTTFESRAAAEADLETFARTLSEVLGTGSVFRVSAHDGNWQWSTDEKEIVASPGGTDQFEDEWAALAAVSRVKRLAGEATLRRPEQASDALEDPDTVSGGSHR
jgi:cellulose synthase/poly-beta-1,6-N-acetylglucosamine synthase-like glycosyltransferase